MGVAWDVGVARGGAWPEKSPKGQEERPGSLEVSFLPMKKMHSCPPGESVLLTKPWKKTIQHVCFGVCLK